MAPSSGQHTDYVGANSKCVLFADPDEEPQSEFSFGEGFDDFDDEAIGQGDGRSGEGKFDLGIPLMLFDDTAKGKGITLEVRGDGARFTEGSQDTARRKDFAPAGGVEEEMVVATQAFAEAFGEEGHRHRRAGSSLCRDRDRERRSSILNEEAHKNFYRD